MDGRRSRWSPQPRRPQCRGSGAARARGGVPHGWPPVFGPTGGDGRMALSADGDGEGFRGTSGSAGGDIHDGINPGGTLGVWRHSSFSVWRASARGGPLQSQWAPPREFLRDHPGPRHAGGEAALDLCRKGEGERHGPLAARQEGGSGARPAPEPAARHCRGDVSVARGTVGVPFGCGAEEGVLRRTVGHGGFAGPSLRAAWSPRALWTTSSPRPA